MNKRFIFYLLGCVLCFEAAFLILPWIVSLVYGESQGWSYLACVVIYGLIGGMILLYKLGFATLLLTICAISAIMKICRRKNVKLNK